MEWEDPQWVQEGLWDLAEGQFQVRVVQWGQVITLGLVALLSLVVDIQVLILTNPTTEFTN